MKTRTALASTLMMGLIGLSFVGGSQIRARRAASECTSPVEVVTLESINSSDRVATDQVAMALFKKWMNSYRLLGFCHNYGRSILSYKFTNVPHHEDYWPPNTYATTFSVQLPPQFTLNEQWEVGNGSAKTLQGWIENKSLFFDIEKKENVYRMNNIRTSPE